MKQYKPEGTTPVLSLRQKLIRDHISFAGGNRVPLKQLKEFVSKAEGNTTVTSNAIMTSIREINRKGNPNGLNKIITGQEKNGHPTRGKEGYYDTLQRHLKRQKELHSLKM